MVLPQSGLPFLRVVCLTDGHVKYIPWVCSRLDWHDMLKHCPFYTTYCIGFDLLAAIIAFNAVTSSSCTCKWMCMQYISLR